MIRSRTLLGAAFALLFGTACAQGLVINEVDYDQPDTDTAEFIELKNTSDTATELGGLTLELVNGNGGTVYGTFTLPDGSLAAGDYFVICADTATVANCDLDVTPDSNLIQNGAPDGIRLLNGTTLLDAVTYEGDIAGVTEGSGIGLEDTGAGSLARTPDGTDTDQNSDDFAFQATITPGAANPEPVTTPTALRIHQIQGNGLESPEIGTYALIEGVVTADFQQATELGGFFVQEQDAETDEDASTSEGIFVLAPTDTTTDVSVGDLVEVTATVGEQFGLTRLANVDSVTVLSSGNALPAATDVALPVSTDSDLEAVEGMLVTFPDPLTVTETYNLGRYGEISLSAIGRLITPTNVVEPGTPALAKAEENDLARILLDDASDTQNPEPVPHGLTSEDPIRGGDTVTGLTGVISYGFNQYRVQPTETVEFTEANPRPAAPPAVDGNVKVASFNVLNYFTTIDTGTPACGPAGDQDCRGADSAEELERQRAKILAALTALDADILGLIEIQNDESASLQDLVDGLNAEFGAGTYAAIDTGTIGTDAIKVALLYRPAVVTPAGAFEVLDATDDPDFVDTKNRPVLIQTFDHVETGERFTVAVNHLKSKGSDCDDLGDPDLDDGQGNCNITRLEAAQALVDFLATDPTGSGDEDHLIIGDLNSYLQEDPIDAIEAAGFVNLIEEQLGTDAYTYVFDGEWGVLDHALATPDLAAQADVAIWHINADEPRIYDYQTEFNPEGLYSPTPYRSSDHDPVLVGLQLAAAEAPSASVSVSLPEGVDPDEAATVTLEDTQAVALRARLAVPETSEPVAVEGLTFGLATLEAEESVSFDRFVGARVVLDADADGQADEGEAVLGTDATLEGDQLVIALDEPLEVQPGEAAELLLLLDLEAADGAGEGDPEGNVPPAGVALALLLGSPLWFASRRRRVLLTGLALALALLLGACGGQPDPTPEQVTVQVTLEAIDATSGGIEVTVDGLPLEGQKLVIEQ